MGVPVCTGVPACLVRSSLSSALPPRHSPTRHAWTVTATPLPDGAIARFGTVRYRVGNCDKCALSPDGKTLAVHEWKSIALWDVESGRVMRRIRDPDGTIDAHLRFSLDGKQLVRANDGELCVWDTATRRRRYSRRLPHHVSGVAFLPESSLMAVTAATDPASVFEPVFGIRVSSTDVEVFAHNLSPGGRFLMGESEHRLVLMDSRNGRVRARFPDLEWPWGGWQCVLSPDDARLYATNGDGRLYVFDTRTTKKLEEIAPPPGWTDPGGRDGLALSPDGHVAYLTQGHQPTRRRDLKAGQWLDPLPAMPDGELVPSSEGKRVLHIGDDGILRRYDLQTLKEIPSRDRSADVFGAAVAPDGRRIALLRSGSKYQLDLVDLTGRVIWSVSDPDGVGRPNWSPDGRWLACVRGERGVILRDAATGKEGRQLQSPGHYRSYSTSVEFFPGGERVVVSYGDGHLLASFDVKTGDCTGSLRTNEKGAVAISPDGRTMAFANTERGVALFDLSAGRWRVPYTQPSFPMRLSPDITFSPDGIYLASSHEEGVLLRDPGSAAPIRTISTGDRPTIDRFAFSPDGQWLALSKSYSLSLWDVASGRVLASWDGHRGHIQSIAFSGPGRVLTHAEDCTALLWDLRPKEKPTRAAWDALTGDDPVEGYRAVWAVADDPNGPALLRAKIAPAKPAKPAQVKQWLADLGADRYPAREAAARELQDLGWAVEQDLRAARMKATSEEVRMRLDALLTKLTRERTHAEVVHVRAVAAMELAGTVAAKKVLAEWAAGAPGARLTIDAKAAIERLGR